MLIFEQMLLGGGRSLDGALHAQFANNFGAYNDTLVCADVSATGESVIGVGGTGTSSTPQLRVACTNADGSTRWVRVLTFSSLNIILSGLLFDAAGHVLVLCHMTASGSSGRTYLISLSGTNGTTRYERSYQLAMGSVRPHRAGVGMVLTSGGAIRMKIPGASVVEVDPSTGAVTEVSQPAITATVDIRPDGSMATQRAGGSVDTVVSKLVNGAVTWSRAFKYNAAQTYPLDVVLGSDGAVTSLTGPDQDPSVTASVQIAHYSAAGVLQWVKTLQRPAPALGFVKLARTDSEILVSFADTKDSTSLISPGLAGQSGYLLRLGLDGIQRSARRFRAANDNLQGIRPINALFTSSGRAMILARNEVASDTPLTFDLWGLEPARDSNSVLVSGSISQTVVPESAAMLGNPAAYTDGANSESVTTPTVPAFGATNTVTNAAGSGSDCFISVYR